MDAYTACEESYKNGYKQGYTDAMAEFDLIRPETSRRGAKFKALMTEAQYHSDKPMDIVKAISDELSWRVIMRVIHRLKRKRGAE